MKRFAVFCSGHGSNLQAIINAVRRGDIRACIALAVSDRKDAYALERARKAGIPVLYVPRGQFRTRRAHEEEILKNLKEKKVDFIVLAGYMRMLSPGFVRRFKYRILNIHPALLPSFKGIAGVKEAWEYGVKVTGPTVHFVDTGMDSGPVILQESVRVREDDTEDTLAVRIHRAEHRIYPRAVRLFVSGGLKINGRRVKILRP